MTRFLNETLIESPKNGAGGHLTHKPMKYPQLRISSMLYVHLVTGKRTVERTVLFPIHQTALERNKKDPGYIPESFLQEAYHIISTITCPAQ